MIKQKVQNNLYVVTYTFCGLHDVRYVEANSEKEALELFKNKYDFDVKNIYKI